VEWHPDVSLEYTSDTQENRNGGNRRNDEN